MNEQLNMIISGIIEKDGEKKACVRFEGTDCFAEGYIPDCKISSSKGFSDEDINNLEIYLKENLANLKRRAAGVDPILSMIRD